jgi:hypothetical protein
MVPHGYISRQDTNMYMHEQLNQYEFFSYNILDFIWRVPKARSKEVLVIVDPFLKNLNKEGLSPE